MCRAKTLHSLSGRKQAQDTPHYMCALDMLQVCDDARAGAVLNDLTVLAAPQHHRQGTLFTLTVNTLAAADFLLTHAANPDRGNGSLRFVYGAAGYLDMTTLLPVIFAMPVAASGLLYQGSLVGNRRRSIGLHGWT